MFHDGDGVAHLAVGEVVAGAVGVPVLLPSSPLLALQLVDVLSCGLLVGVVELVVEAFPLPPGGLFGVGDVVG